MATITEQLGGGEEGMRVLDSSPLFIDKRRSDEEHLVVSGSGRRRTAIARGFARGNGSPPPPRLD
jgi:hypothetical protein